MSRGDGRSAAATDTRTGGVATGRGAAAGGVVAADGGPADAADRRRTGTL